MNIKAVAAVLLSTAVLATSSVSCSYDDTKIWAEIEGIKKELAALRESVETELNALKALLDGAVTIKSIKKTNDGSTVLVLSDGTQITVYPKGGGVLSDIVTVINENGKYYWAMFDGVGNKQPILVDGQKVPVADAAPQTRVNEDTQAIEVSFDGGNTWYTTGYSESAADSIITDINVVYSDWQVDGDGNPLALYCVLTLNDGSVVKVGMQNGKLVLASDTMFVAYGSIGTFYLDVQDAADYLTQVPRGWECDVKHKVKDGRMELTFTAPTYEDIVAGNAVATGVMKLMIVFNNGSSAIASIKLSTNPANVQFTTEGIYVEVGYGTSYLIGGLMSKSAYETNFDKTFAAANEHLAGSTSSVIYDMSFMESTRLYIPFSTIMSTIKAGNEYVFWYASPKTSEEGDMYITELDVCDVAYKHVTATLTVKKADFFDLNVEFKVPGADADHEYMIGYCRAEEFNAEELATYYTDYPEYFVANYSEQTYSGSFLSLVDPYATKLDPNTSYVMWYINEASLPNVLVDNVLSWSVTTSAFTTGGSVEVAVSDVAVEYTSIDMKLSSTGHIAMYYNLMPSYMASAYPNDELIIEMLTTEGQRSYTTEPVNVAFTGAEAGTELTLFAVAVDAEGRYGEILTQEYKTKAFEYSDAELVATLMDYKIDNTRVSVECADAVKYVYVYCPTSSDEWTKVYGGSKKKAGEFMIANAGDSRIHDTDITPLVDGCICIGGLTMDVEYAIVVMGIDANGVYTQPQALYFKPIANIGDVVKRDNAHWEVGKPSIEILEYEDNPHLFLSFSWATVPGEHTKVYTAAMFRDNLINDEYGTNINTVEKLIAEIISSCDTGGMSEQGKSFEWSETGEYLREWTEWEDTDGDNYLEEVYHSEVHEYGYHFFPYGSNGATFIYTTWVCEDGNFHEPFAIDPVTGEEVSLW